MHTWKVVVLFVCGTVPRGLRDSFHVSKHLAAVTEQKCPRRYTFAKLFLLTISALNPRPLCISATSLQAGLLAVHLFLNSDCNKNPLHILDKD